MTRYARSKSVYKHSKQPEQATPWSEYLIKKNASEKNMHDVKTDSSSTKNLSTKKRKLANKKTPKAIKKINIESDKTFEDKSGYSLKPKTKKKSKKLKLKVKKVKNSSSEKTNSVENEGNPGKQDVGQDSEVLSDKQKNLNKKNKSQKLKEFRIMKRKENGITLLPEKIENKIYRLKSALRKKGMPGEEIKAIVRKERRKEELKYKKETKQVCFHCREPGHQIANCPKLLNDTEQGTGICFKCGSTEHKVNNCSAKIDDFPFAKCFICGKQGHLSRSCPDNQKGLYPHGGGCKQCGKNDHLRKDCPELIDTDGTSEMLLPTMKSNISADAEIDEYFQDRKTDKHKVIKF